MKTLTKTLAAVAVAIAALLIRVRATDRPAGPAPGKPPPSKVDVRITADSGETIATFEVDRERID